MTTPVVDGLHNNRPVSVSPGTEDVTAELSAVVDELLTSLSSKFSDVSTEILAKMDEMSKRLDALEATIQPNDETNGSPIK
ncbi:MAG: hypothetical protein M1818_006856 [Claussenomyces sp. TS43310]|nr:MAG: hypothetical protein M1818_006856 [Claussenomyces sp. TS43310]